jgi:hypothetical protein
MSDRRPLLLLDTASLEFTKAHMTAQGARGPERNGSYTCRSRRRT